MENSSKRIQFRKQESGNVAFFQKGKNPRVYSRQHGKNCGIKKQLNCKEKVKQDLEGKENMGYIEKIMIKTIDNLQISVKYFFNQLNF